MKPGCLLIAVASIVTCLAGTGVPVSGQASQPASAPEELLWPQGAPGSVGDQIEDKPSLTMYRPAKENANGTAVVVCPGGGYGGLALDHEGKQVAGWLNSLGISAYVLRYRLGPRYRHPAPLTDAQRAVRTVRARATSWNVDPQRIGMIGFSAGGHLVSTAATHFEQGSPDAKDPIERESCRPDFVILCYPVISFTEPYRHKGSVKNLLGPDPAPALLDNLSNEKQVTAQTPPTFLFHTDSDTGVPPENSVAFYLALRKARVPAELHIYAKGPHGVGLAPQDPILSTWPQRCADWLRVIGMLPPAR